MGRRDLNGVAAGLATSFVSRNNDLDGYWSLGLLRRLADRQRRESLHFDILSGSTDPQDPMLAHVCRAYRAALSRQLIVRNLDRALVAKADILVSFNAPPLPVTAPAAATYGPPFSCCVRLLDDREKEHSHTVVAHCAPHDPRFERRSTRPFRLAPPK